MKSLLCLCCMLAIVFLCLALVPASAQQAQPGSRGSSDQWTSHQMNQPPPGAGDKDLSKDRLDDIRELYELARKEAEAKAAPKPADKK
ncbi:MAG: hypothetical protein HY913_13935 [Desulfomonile tiedjei]|nr:hypothetical protein [Desulfomonile tiedjei]